MNILKDFLTNEFSLENPFQTKLFDSLEVYISKW